MLKKYYALFPIILFFGFFSVNKSMVDFKFIFFYCIKYSVQFVWFLRWSAVEDDQEMQIDKLTIGLSGFSSKNKNSIGKWKKENNCYFQLIFRILFWEPGRTWSTSRPLLRHSNLHNVQIFFCGFFHFCFVIYFNLFVVWIMYHKIKVWLKFN